MFSLKQSQCIRNCFLVVFAAFFWSMLTDWFVDLKKFIVKLTLLSIHLCVPPKNVQELPWWFKKKVIKQWTDTMVSTGDCHNYVSFDWTWNLNDWTCTFCLTFISMVFFMRNKSESIRFSFFLETISPTKKFK